MGEMQARADHDLLLTFDVDRIHVIFQNHVMFPKNHDPI
jgi:hypothetical protein